LASIYGLLSFRSSTTEKILNKGHNTILLHESSVKSAYLQRQRSLFILK